MSNYTQVTFFAPKDLLISGNPAKLIKGADVDPELNAIAVAIATKYDSSSIASAPVLFNAGSAPLPSIAFTGGTNNNTGLYLAAANSLGFSANGVSAGVISTAGAWAVPAASSGDSFSITGPSGANALTLTPNGGGQGLNFSVNHSGGIPAIRFTDSNGAPQTFDIGLGIGDATARLIVYDRTHSLQRLSISGTAPFIQGSGVVNTGLVDMTPDKGTFTMTLTGMSAGTTVTAQWSRNGNQVTINVPTITGTSNATSFTCTGLPASIQPTNQQCVSVALADLGAAGPTVGPVAGQISGGTITWFTGGSSTAFGTAAAKGFPLGATFSYEIN